MSHTDRRTWHRWPFWMAICKPKTNALTIVEKMKSQKQILIKSYSNVGNFGTCLRVTIGAKQYMERFLDALFELDNTN